MSKGMFGPKSVTFHERWVRRADQLCTPTELKLTVVKGICTIFRPACDDAETLKFVDRISCTTCHGEL